MKYKLRSTKQYDKWFSKLKEPTVKIRVLGILFKFRGKRRLTPRTDFLDPVKTVGYKIIL